MVEKRVCWMSRSPNRNCDDHGSSLLHSGVSAPPRFFWKMQVMDFEDTNMGYNAATGEFCDLVKAGIIDPLKV